MKLETMQDIHKKYQENIRIINSKLVAIENQINFSLDRINIAKDISQLRIRLENLNEIFKTIQQQYDEKIESKIISNLGDIGQIIYYFIKRLSQVASNYLPNLKKFADEYKTIGESLIFKYSTDIFMYSDQDILRKLYDFNAKLRIYLDQLDSSLAKRMRSIGYEKEGNIPLKKLFYFISFIVRDWPGLNDQWTCAASYLSALEICVNKAGKKLNIRVEEYKKKLNLLISKMKTENVEIGIIEKDLVSRFYDYRNNRDISLS